MLGAGFTPMVITGLILAAGGALWPVAVFWVAILLIAFVAVLSTPEGTRRELD
jgi:hypothetical protein